MGGSNRVGGWGWGVVGGPKGYRMKQEDDWNPEAKFGLSMALKSLQID